jgi:hypothetical protein
MLIKAGFGFGPFHKINMCSEQQGSRRLGEISVRVREPFALNSKLHARRRENIPNPDVPLQTPATRNFEGVVFVTPHSSISSHLETWDSGVLQ